MLPCQLGPQLVDLMGFAKPIDHEVRTLTRQSLGDPQSNAAGRTGYKSEFSFEHGNHPEAVEFGR
jgi:hypothetical protein